MTPNEFKAWFEGFVEAVTDCPTKKQWKRIVERVGEIDGVPVTVHHYHDRYWPSVQPYYGYWQPAVAPFKTDWSTITCGASLGENQASIQGACGQTEAAPVTWDSSAAMRDLGKADYLSSQG